MLTIIQTRIHMRDYRITIRSTVDGETNEVIALGDVVKEYGSTTINYEDDVNNNSTRIVVGQDIVSIIRGGDMNTIMTFEKGKTTYAAIRTEYGDIPLDLETTDITCGEWANGVNLGLKYVTNLAGESSKFDVSVKAEKINC